MSDILTKKQSLSLMERTMNATTMPQARVGCSSSHHALTRFAANALTQNVARSDQSLVLEVARNGKHGSAATNQVAPSALAQLARSAERAANYAPKDSEYLSPPSRQSLDCPGSYSPCDTWLNPENRVAIVSRILSLGKRKGLRVSGVLSMLRESRGMKTSKGFEGYQRISEALCSVSMEGQDGSGWAEQISSFPETLDPIDVAQRAMNICLHAQRPKEIQPGDYPVILAPEAVASLFAYWVWQMDAREADEKRSCFSGRMGQRIGDVRVHLHSQPLHAEAPGSSFNAEGIPARDCSWIDRGVLKNLSFSRFWARKKGVRRFTFPCNLILDGGDGALEDLLQGVSRGIFITRLWYIRMVEPMSLTLTGLTRDGTFWVERGKPVKPIRNLRFNDSPLRLLSQIEQMGAPCRVQAPLPACFPPLSLKSFRFTSLATK